MKRSLVAILLITALAAPIFALPAPALPVGSVWYDSQNPNPLLPSSIPNYVSNGIFADEVDYIFRSPVNLADYQGYSIYTAYGNYGSMLPGGLTWVNPFTTVNPTFPDEIGAYQLAAAFPVLGFRAGALLGHTYKLTGRITGLLRNEVKTTNHVEDQHTLGTADYTTVASYDATNTEDWSLTGGTAGISLGQLGLSLLVSQSGNARTMGGSKTYAWTIGTDAAYIATLPGSNVTTAETLYVGYGQTGKAKSYGSDGTLTAAVLGQYKLAGIPLVAELGFNMSNGDLDQTIVKTDYSRTVAYASTAGLAAVATDINTYTMSYGTNRSGLWSMSAAFPGWSATPAAYLDPAKSKDGSFDFNVTLGAEPAFNIDDALSFKTRGFLSVESRNSSTANSKIAASTFSLATTAAENDTWAYSFASFESTTSGTINLGFELGGMAEFKEPSSFITLGAGLFLKPVFGFGSTTKAPKTETRTRAYTDSVNVNPITATQTNNLTPSAAANVITAGTGTAYEGSSTYSSTETWAGKDSTNSAALSIHLPTAVRLSFKEGKLAAIFGYTLVHESMVTTYKYADSKLVETATVSDGSTTVYSSTSTTNYPAGADLTATTTTVNGVTKVIYSNRWDGQMGWCFRLAPSNALTIDLEGNSIMTALNGIGFNDFMLDDILANLSLSATFRF